MAEIDQELIQRINLMIDQRTHYGVRTEVAQARGHIIAWSNSAAEWWLYAQAEKKGSTIRLDANQVFVSGVSYYRLYNVLQYLNPLPLYAASFEAKERGSYRPDIHMQAKRRG